MDPVKRKAMIFQEQDYLRQTYPVAYIVRMGVVAGVSKKLIGGRLRADEKYYFFENQVVK